MMAAPFYGVSETVAHWANLICAVVAVLTAGYCLWRARRTGSAVPVYILLGSLLTIVLEPFFDVLGSVVMPNEGVGSWVGLLGRPMPIYNSLIYIFYWSGGVVYVVDRINAGISLQQWLILGGVFVLSAMLFELYPIALGMWRYYGVQPLQVGGFPLWWAFVNSNAVMTAGAAVVLLHRLLGARSWLIVFLLPGTILGLHTAAALPGHAAVSTTSDYGLALLGTLLAIAGSCLYTWLFGIAIARRPVVG